MTKRAIWMIVGLVLLGLGLSLSWNEAPGLTVAAHYSENPKPEFNRKGELLRTLARNRSNADSLLS